LTCAHPSPCSAARSRGSIVCAACVAVPIASEHVANGAVGWIRSLARTSRIPSRVLLIACCGLIRQLSIAPPQELLLLAVPPDVVEPIARGRIVARKLDEVRTRTRTRTLTCACRCTLDRVRTHTGASTHRGRGLGVGESA
jgi:hypothetical protein